MPTRFPGAVLIVALALLCAGSAGAADWDRLSPADRRKALEKYRIYKQMPRSRQQEIQRSYQEWQHMQPTDKERIRRNYKAYRDLSPEQRRAIGKAYRRGGG